MNSWIKEYEKHPSKQALIDFKEVIHKVAGSAGSYGYSEVTQLCLLMEKTLEKKLEEFSKEKVPESLREFDDFFHRFKLAFQNSDYETKREKKEVKQPIYRLKKYDQAEREVNKVLDHNESYFDALVAAGLIALAKNENQNAEIYFQRGLELEPTSTECLFGMGRVRDREREFTESFDYFYRAYQINPYNPGVISGVVKTRPYVNPTLYTKGGYSQERENDLVLKIRTTQINFANGVFGAIYPINDKLRLYAIHEFQQTEQKNLISKINNYLVNTYLFTMNAQIFFKEVWAFLARNQMKWSHGEGLVLFPFENKASWEPGLLIDYSGFYNFFSIEAYMDSFIARDGINAASFMVERKNIKTSYEMQYMPPYGKGGIVVRHSNYNDFLNNIEREIELYLQFPELKFGGDWLLQYQWDWRSFNEISPDYSSYRYRVKHNVQLTYLIERKNEALLKFFCIYSWNKMRDFTNEATAIIDPVTNLPQILKSNIFRGYTVGALVRKVFETHFFVEFSTTYYADSDRYHYWRGTRHPQMAVLNPNQGSFTRNLGN